MNSKQLLPFVLGIAALVLPAGAQTSGPKYIITTFAGTPGINGYAGDSGAAKSAQFNTPMYVSRDSNGNVWVPDQVNHRVRKIDSSGNITTVAGTGTSGSTGDDAAATSALLDYPVFVLVDTTSNVYYIADYGNNRIRKVDSSGYIRAFGGNGTAGYTYADTTSDSTATLAAKDAELNHPMGMAFDSTGAIYFADTHNHIIRKIDSSGNITTIAGNGTAGYDGDGGAATDAELNFPHDIAFDKAGNLYISDTSNDVIRKIDTKGIITTVAGDGHYGFKGDGGPALDASFFFPKGLAVDSSGNLYIADSINSRIRMVTSGGVIYTIAGNGRYGYYGDGGLATNASLKFPTGVTVGANGALYVVDNQNGRIALLTPASDSDLPTQLPIISSSRVASSDAYGAVKAMAPGSWIDIQGANLAAATRQWNDTDFTDGVAPISLEGTSVTIGGKNAFVSAVSPTRITAQLPDSAGTGPLDIVVANALGESEPRQINLDSIAPALATPPAFKVTGKQYVAALFDDGTTYAMPAGAVRGVESRPAAFGDRLTLYGTGFGSVTPYQSAGTVVSADNALDLPVEVFIDGMPATVVSAGLAVGNVGLYQIVIEVPQVSDNHSALVQFRLGGSDATQQLYIAIQN